MMTPEQCRMARAALDMSIADLAAATNLRPMTISGFERGADCRRSTVETLEGALRAHGLIFISADDQAGPGVRLR